MSYEHLKELDDPSKPYRRVYRCASGVLVKVHATPRSVGFGRVQWDFTGSHCDEFGKAFAYGDGFAIHCDHSELSIACDTEWTEEQREDGIRVKREEQFLAQVRRVESAVLNERAALAVSGL